MEGIGSLLATGGSGMSSQQSPVSFPFSFRSSYNVKWSACVGFLDKAQYLFGGGNSSETAWFDSIDVDFLFLRWHSKSFAAKVLDPVNKKCGCMSTFKLSSWAFTLSQFYFLLVIQVNLQLLLFNAISVAAVNSTKPCTYTQMRTSTSPGVWFYFNMLRYSVSTCIFCLVQ